MQSCANKRGRNNSKLNINKIKIASIITYAEKILLQNILFNFLSVRNVELREYSTENFFENMIFNRKDGSLSEKYLQERKQVIKIKIKNLFVDICHTFSFKVNSDIPTKHCKM